MFNFIKKYKILIIISYFVINFVIFFFNINNGDVYVLPKQVLYLILASIMIVSIVLIGAVLSKQDDLAVHKIFVLMALPLGIMYLMATPLFKGHDEIRQWYKAYAVSDGYMMSVKRGNKIGDIVPEGAKKIYDFEGVKYYEIDYYTTGQVIKLIDKQPHDDNKIFVNNKAMAMYPFLQMVPQATGISIGKVLHVNIFMQAMFGRLINFLFYVLLGCLALKIMPVKKIFLMAFLLCPKIMYLATTLSGDVTTFSVIILFCAYVISLMYYKKPLVRKDYVFFAIILPLISVFKIIYFPICLLLLLLPKECFKNNTSRFIVVGSYLLLSLSFAMAWMTISMYFLNQGYNNSALQIKFILSHPFTYTSIMIKTVVINGSIWLLDMVGGYMEYGTHFFLNCFITIYVYIVLYLCFISEKKHFVLSKMQHLITIFIFLIILVLMLTALYVQWTAGKSGVGFDVVTGVQGRYFIPIILLMTMLIPWRSKNKLNIDDNILYLLILAWQLPTLLSIITRNL